MGQPAAGACTHCGPALGATLLCRFLQDHIGCRLTVFTSMCMSYTYASLLTWYTARVRLSPVAQPGAGLLCAHHTNPSVTLAYAPEAACSPTVLSSHRTGTPATHHRSTHRPQLCQNESGKALHGDRHAERLLNKMLYTQPGALANRRPGHEGEPRQHVHSNTIRPGFADMRNQPQAAPG